MTFINSQIETEQGIQPIQVALISAYLMPSRLMYKAMHNDYSEHSITKEIAAGKIPTDEEAKSIIIKKLLKGNRGHFGVLEHCPLIFHIKGIDPLELVELKPMPSVIIREFPAHSQVIYLKCNIRSFLGIMDYYILKGVHYSSFEVALDSMWKLFAEYVPNIAEWYSTERKPLLLRKLQPNF